MAEEDELVPLGEGDPASRGGEDARARPAPDDTTLLEALHEQEVIDPRRPINPATGLPQAGPLSRPSPAPFQIELNSFGPGVHSVKLAHGTPVGVWLAAKHPYLDAPGVLELLLGMGLEEPHASDFARRRGIRDKETKTLAAVIGPDSAWAQFVKVEAERSKKLEPLRKAFIDAKRKGEKK